MEQHQREWDKDIETNSDDEYQALIRALSWTEGFGLLFVDCTPLVGEELIAKVREDLPQKRIEVLNLTEPIDNLYEKIANLENRVGIDILFVKGLEKSIYDYEKHLKDQSEGLKYPLGSVPRFLSNLNLQRESLRDKLHICLVFLLPKFALTYFNRRAPDFYDWRSGVFEFEGKGEKSQLALSQNENEFWFNQGYQEAIAGDLLEAIASWDKAIELDPDDYRPWIGRGLALFNLGRLEEAIASYDRAIQIKPDNDAAWNNRGNALFNLGRLEEAIASYD
ncbi:MAG TPA: hypothetical protein DDW51_08205, partial [Cyanobacteria bacterium UBA11367]|nr:hypothetical protein [Cyanobacteria bacterium UBA11367]